MIVCDKCKKDLGVKVGNFNINDFIYHKHIKKEMIKYFHFCAECEKDFIKITDNIKQKEKGIEENIFNMRIECGFASLELLNSWLKERKDNEKNT